MNKVITPVGTSIMTNYMKRHNDIDGSFHALINVRHREWNNYTNDILCIKNALTGCEWLTCAEIDSLKKIRESVNKPVEIFLLATDTVLSRLAAELIKAYFDLLSSSDRMICNFNPKNHIISGLQVSDKKEFEEKGIQNLIDKFYRITNNRYQDFILNITGGYKALIPYLTIMGQIYDIPMFYLFEETDDIIRFPPAPIEINFELFDLYKKSFETITRNQVKEDQLDPRFLNESAKFLSVSDQCVRLNPLGEILWKKYQTKQIRLDENFDL